MAKKTGALLVAGGDARRSVRLTAAARGGSDGKDPMSKTPSAVAEKGSAAAHPKEKSGIALTKAVTDEVGARIVRGLSNPIDADDFFFGTEDARSLYLASIMAAEPASSGRAAVRSRPLAVVVHRFKDPGAEPVMKTCIKDLLGHCASVRSAECSALDLGALGVSSHFARFMGTFVARYGVAGGFLEQMHDNKRVLKITPAQIAIVLTKISRGDGYVDASCGIWPISEE